MIRNALMILVIAFVLIGMAACIEPSPIDDPDPSVDPVERYGSLFDESLVFFAGFDDDLGSDSSVYGRQGAVEGPTSAEGRFGSAASFSGSDSNRIHYEYDDAFAMDSAVSVSSWVYRVGDGQSSTSVVVGRPVVGRSSHQHYSLGITPTNNVRWRLRFGTTLVDCVSGSVIPEAVWTHVVGTYDGGVMRVYLNGEQGCEVSRSGVLSSESAPLVIGSVLDDSADGRRFSGRADEIALYNKALSADEVSLLYDLEDGLQPLLDEYVVPGSVDPITPPPDDPISPPGDRVLSLRGDPDFDVSQLSAEQRARYERFWQELRDPSNRAEIDAMAESDCIFVYARGLKSHIQAVLIAFRATGDLELLDYVDEVAQIMHSQLADPWRGTNDGTDGTTDGYLNWAFRPYSGGTDQHVGKDTRRIDEMGSHANAAIIAYALHANRDLTSPTGRDYGASADEWQDYLVNHFEAKWRERRNRASGFPIMFVPSTGTYRKWIQWHYYMGKLTEDSAYTAEANRMADIFWDHMFPIETPSGTAYVYSGGISGLNGANSHILGATTYAGHMYGTAVELHLEGFHEWGNDENLRRLARTFTEFIIDTDDPIANGMARDVGGGEPRLHLEATENTRHQPLGLPQYRDRNFGFVGPWDHTGEINSITEEVQSRYGSRDTTRLAAALFFNSYYE